VRRSPGPLLLLCPGQWLLGSEELLAAWQLRLLVLSW
jgi:hypothetical protein